MMISITIIRATENISNEIGNAKDIKEEVDQVKRMTQKSNTRRKSHSLPSNRL